jgi:hypothetical protein
MWTAVLVASHAAAAGLGVYAGPHVATLVAAWKGSRAVKTAAALVAKAEADAKALEAARAVVAAQPKPAATGPKGA